MKEKIAVLVDQKGKTASVYKASSIVVYEKLEGQWQEVQRRTCMFAEIISMRELRRQMEEMIGFLDDCRLVVAEIIAGVPYYELEKAQISICEFTGQAQDLLETVWQLEQKNPVQTQSQINMPTFQLLETFPGCYRISLKEIQSSLVLLSSKQVLLPILQKGDFNTLEVICSHVPPWLEIKLAGDQYQSYIEKGQQECRIVIENKANPISAVENGDI